MASNNIRPQSRLSAGYSYLVSSRVSTMYFLYIISIATMGPLQFGYHLGELNAPQRFISCQDDLPVDKQSDFRLPQCISLNRSQWGLVQSIFTVGGFLGASIGGPLATKYGRLRTMQVTTVFFILGPLASALADNMEPMILGRFLSGIGAGASTVICPLYVAEVSPPGMRGFFGALTQVMINVGILLAQLLGYFLSHDNLWRVIFAIAALIGALELIGLQFVMESPHWQAKNAYRAVARRASQSVEDPVEIDSDADVSKDCFANLRARTTAGGHSNTQERTCSGAGRLFGVVMYSVEILGTALPSAATFVTVTVSAINVIVTIMCAPLADKIGRKPCLLLSISGVGTGSFLLALSLSCGLPALSVFAIFLFVGSFGVGLGLVPFVLASELVDPEAVGATQSWGLATCWLATFCVAQFFPILNAALPTGYAFWVFMAIAICTGSFISWWIPESGGKATPAEVWGDH